SGHVRKVQIKQHQIWSVMIDLVQRIGPAGRHLDGISDFRQSITYEFGDAAFILDDQDAMRTRARHLGVLAGVAVTGSAPRSPEHPTRPAVRPATPRAPPPNHPR